MPYYINCFVKYVLSIYIKDILHVTGRSTRAVRGC